MTATVEQGDAPVRWAPVRGYEEIYEVSTEGQVRRRAYLRRNATRAPMRGFFDKDGYRKLQLCSAGVRVKFFVHRIVLEAFAGPCPEGCEARHLNGVRSDNRIQNLEWGTHRENCADKSHHGTVLLGSRHPMAKLTEEQAVAIRAARGTTASIARRLNVPVHAAYGVRQGKTWRHV